MENDQVARSLDGGGDGKIYDKNVIPHDGSVSTAASSGKSGTSVPTVSTALHSCMPSGDMREVLRVKTHP